MNHEPETRRALSGRPGCDACLRRARWDRPGIGHCDASWGPDATTGTIHNFPLGTNVEGWRSYRNGSFTGCQEMTGTQRWTNGVQGTFSNDPCSGRGPSGHPYYGDGVFQVSMWYHRA